ILLPGFVNAHSHAFHRHLRGRSEIGGKAADTFWKWRDNMYALVDGITEEKLYEYCLSTFREMLAAGITSVGEFHYVHHGTGRFDLDKAVLRAAEDAGIRITLIQTFYENAGFDKPALHPVQERFVSDYREFVDNFNELLLNCSKTVTIAVAGKCLNLLRLKKTFAQLRTGLGAKYSQQRAKKMSSIAPFYGDFSL
ncbi:amidohydrolase family protein, partial [Oesophagostomum dentatum]